MQSHYYDVINLKPDECYDTIKKVGISRNFLVVLELVRGLITNLSLHDGREVNSFQHICCSAIQVRGGATCS